MRREELRCPTTFGTASLFIMLAAQLMMAGVNGSELRDLKVQCSRSGLTVRVRFSEPFYGIIYSQDHYGVAGCTYVQGYQLGGGPQQGDATRTSFTFNVPQRGCGTVSQQGGRKSTAASNAFQRSIDVGGGATPSGLEQQQQIFLENTIIIQNDPDFQEAGDTARRLRCVWGAHALQKSVNAKMAEVYQPTLITVKFDYRSVNQLVEVQSIRGGPLSQPARGFIRSSPTQSSLAVYIKDPGQRLDANMLSCTYINGKTGESVKLTDEDGCSVRPDLTTAFYKIRETGNPNSDLTIYTYFRGLRLPRDGHFGISCVVEICFNRCGERCRNRIP